MTRKSWVFDLFVVFAIMSFAFTSAVLAESTTVTSSGVTFPDGTTQSTAWITSGTNMYYNNGNVGIGTTSPERKLEVVAASAGDGIIIRANSVNRYAPSLTFRGEDNIYLSQIGAAMGNQDFSVDATFGDLVMRTGFDIIFSTVHDNQTYPATMLISNSGNVGIGTASPGYPLEMASGAHVTTGGVWTNASSREYKENIRDLSYDEATLALLSLKPSKFNYKVDKDDDYLGFIAEDVPDLVATKDRKGLSPMDIVAVLTKVVQQQQEEITKHQKENGALNVKLAEVISRLEALEK